MNFDDITARVRKISMDTVAEVQKVNEVRQLNSQIGAEKKRISAMYADMGKKLYDQYRESPLEGFEGDFQLLAGAFETIETLQGQIRAVKGVRLCPNCRMEVGAEERFCSNCGTKMPEVFRIEEEPTAAEVELKAEAPAESAETESAEAPSPESSTPEAVETESSEVSSTEVAETESSEAPIPEAAEAESSEAPTPEGEKVAAETESSEAPSPELVEVESAEAPTPEGEKAEPAKTPAPESDQTELKTVECTDAESGQVKQGDFSATESARTEGAE